MKVVHFGVGNIGRGLIAKLYRQNKFEIVFVDINQNLIDNLNKKGFYYVINFENGEKYKIRSFFAINLKDENNLLKELKESEIISTSVGAKNLIFLEPIFAKLAKINQKDKQIICFENGFRVSSYFKSILGNCQFWDFVDTTIDQIVPNSDDLNVYTETFSEIILEDKNQKIRLKGVKYLQNLDFFILRKLFFVNTLHSGIAYFAYILKINFIHEALNSEIIQSYVHQLKNVLQKVILFENSLMSDEEIDIYFKNIIKRFKNPVLQDPVVRVCRNPVTKISKNERFDLLLKYAKRAKLNTAELNIIYKTFANILNFDWKSDAQAVEMREKLATNPQVFLKNYTNLDNQEIKLVLNFYQKQKR
ncbi:mannitol-1-phosphate 5-dehydrogenase [Mycoplasma flocculare]|uniref:mannitol-1-phosphate 5-dehydrogenase n=1 Tax=Mesomycoplasma flocculare TaxID=2128 RepID=UPI00136F4440|nr:mannitol-1-phosphate 5-dehydrogenase [Mesomycoplasma flocculare]MXR12316.1 mannitol-1-phosphate 5-dehydrogenase [Mesomycoplasma flocculare]